MERNVQEVEHRSIYWFYLTYASSAIIGPDGWVLSAPKIAKEQLIFAHLDLSLVTKTKTLADSSGKCKFHVITIISISIMLTSRIRYSTRYVVAKSRRVDVFGPQGHV